MKLGWQFCCVIVRVGMVVGPWSSYATVSIWSAPSNMVTPTLKAEQGTTLWLGSQAPPGSGLRRVRPDGPSGRILQIHCITMISMGECRPWFRGPLTVMATREKNRDISSRYACLVDGGLRSAKARCTDCDLAYALEAEGESDPPIAQHLASQRRRGDRGPLERIL